ncbi:MAG: hypothetical protein H6742_15410 [Alphaproteobacteria bacterium]|nr:hypothetical protein [Alphaproteobacteria bacterium]
MKEALSPSVELVSTRLVGVFSLAAYPWPWAVFGLVVRMAVDPAEPRDFRSVPCFLLAPASHLGFDAGALERWAKTRSMDPKAADRALRESLRTNARPAPHQWNLHEAMAAGGRALEWATGQVGGTATSPVSGARKVADRHPWTFLFAGVIEPASAALGVAPVEDPTGWALAVLEAAQRAPRPRGRPPKAPDTDPALALRDEVSWLRSQSGRSDSIARDVVEFASELPDLDPPLWSGSPVEDLGRDELVEAARKRRKELRRRHAVPMLVPFVLESWALMGIDEELAALQAWLTGSDTGRRLQVICGSGGREFDPPVLVDR